MLHQKDTISVMRGGPLNREKKKGKKFQGHGRSKTFYRNTDGYNAADWWWLYEEGREFQTLEVIGIKELVNAFFGYPNNSDSDE